MTNVAKDRSEVGGRLAEAEATIERLKGQIATKDAQPQTDPAEIEDLKTKLQKAEDARDKAKDKLKKEKDARQAAIEKELAEQAKIAQPPSGGVRPKFDKGKLLALRRAGWTVKAIAEEMKCSEQTVRNHMKKEKIK